jgi:uncharacterized protein YkwD
LKGSSYIIELIDAEVNRDEMYIAMVMEAGEVDLAKVLSQRQKQSVATMSDAAAAASIAVATNAPASTTSATTSSTSALSAAEATQVELVNPFFARMIWQEMLAAVDYIHQNRIVHGKFFSSTTREIVIGYHT